MQNPQTQNLTTLERVLNFIQKLFFNKNTMATKFVKGASSGKSVTVTRKRTAKPVAAKMKPARRDEKAPAYLKQARSGKKK